MCVSKTQIAISLVVHTNISENLVEILMLRDVKITPNNPMCSFIQFFISFPEYLHAFQKNDLVQN